MTHQGVPLTFSECCLLLRTDQAEQALAQICEAPAFQPAERLYVQAWQAAHQEQWDVLHHILLQTDDSSSEDDRTMLKDMTLRRRRSRLCWLLGNLARQVGQHEDAFGWYTRCIQFLDERRMNDSRLRIVALCGRGAALLQMGALPASLGEFERASELSQKAGLREPDVYAGLCEAHASLGHAEQALFPGHQAMDFPIAPRRKQALRLLLGRCYAHLGEDAKASTLWGEALEAARQEKQHEEAVHSLILLAELNARQGQMREARLLCEQAMLHADKGSPGVRGSLMLLCGRLALADARPEEATRWYQQATQILAGEAAGADLAEAQSALARIAEASGHLEQAAVHWKAAYQATHPAFQDI